MATELVLELGGDTSELQHITAAVEQLAEQHGWPADIAYQVTLALEELQMNIMLHAYPEGVTAHSRIILQCEPDKLIIEISDAGKPFDPLQETPRADVEANLEDRRVGGLGVHLVKSMMDEMSYRREDDRNYLTLVKVIGK